MRVMVVDDKPDNQHLLRALLRGRGWQVNEARHGAEALALAREAPLDLAGTNRRMPVMDGSSSLARCRATKSDHLLPFRRRVVIHGDGGNETVDGSARDFRSAARVMNGDLGAILELLRKQRGFDFAGYPPAMLARRLDLRLGPTGCADLRAYRSYLTSRPEELDQLVGAITINVSQFFRNPLNFELLAERVLPAVISAKAAQPQSSLRVWSAGCARGEEPYSVAILIEELARKEKLKLERHIFATDIDARVLADAANALYSAAAVENVKHRQLAAFFAPEGDAFRLRPEIRRQVIFSLYDMLDPVRRVPPDSVFGDFDLVLCRNLLIYFNLDYQDVIFAKLCDSLAPGGYLMLGEAEMPPPQHQCTLRRVADFGCLYQKQPRSPSCP